MRTDPDCSLASYCRFRSCLLAATMGALGCSWWPQVLSQGDKDVQGKHLPQVSSGEERVPTQRRQARRGAHVMPTLLPLSLVDRKAQRGQITCLMPHSQLVRHLGMRSVPFSRKSRGRRGARAVGRWVVGGKFPDTVEIFLNCHSFICFFIYVLGQSRFVVQVTLELLI